MLLRAVTGGGVQVSFVVVAATVLAVLLLGWRLLYRLLSSRLTVSPHKAANEA
jgi:membrane protein implicated in regulation of membrane protease activity